MTRNTNLTPVQKRFLDAHQRMAFAEEAEDIYYMHSCFCQIGLPRSSTPERELFHKSGRYSLMLQAGAISQKGELVRVPLPYGVTPRILLMYIITYAKKHKTPVVYLGNNQAEFLDKLNISNLTGGKTGSITNFKKQAQALAAARITIGFQDERGIDHTVNSHIVQRSAWEEFNVWAAKDPNQYTLWNSEIQMAPEFYHSVQDHAVPLFGSRMLGLQNNALSLDLYSYLAHRLPRLHHGKDLFLTWEMLRQQFCPNYSDASNGGFRAKFNTAMTKALLMYPEARVDKERHGYRLKASPFLVPETLLLP